MLGVEERKEEARSNLAAATQNRDVEMLEDALEEATEIMLFFFLKRIQPSCSFAVLTSSFQSSIFLRS